MFPILYGHHAVALGFVILFNPFPAALGIAYAHLLFYVLYIVGNLKFMFKLAGIMLTCTQNLIK